MACVRSEPDAPLRCHLWRPGQFLAHSCPAPGPPNGDESHGWFELGLEGVHAPLGVGSLGGVARSFLYLQVKCRELGRPWIHGSPVKLRRGTGRVER